MKRGRHNKSKHKKAAAAAALPPEKPPPAEFRNSVQPIVVICHSDWSRHKTDCFCSKSNQWPVLVYNPDTNKWWDRLQKSSRVRHGPPPPTGETTRCHAIVVYDRYTNNNNNNNNNNGGANQNNNNNNNNEDDRFIPHKALQRLGEGTEIATVALLGTAPAGVKEDLETVLEPQRILMVPQTSVFFSNYLELRQLWAFQDAHDSMVDSIQLDVDQVPQICKEWSSLKWRWKGPQLIDLYRRLQHHREGGLWDANEPKDDESKEEKQNHDDKKNNNSANDQDDNHEIRRVMEEKLALLLTHTDTQRVADLILTGGCTLNDPNLFGRVHAAAESAAQRLGGMAEYLVVAPSSSQKGHATPILNAYQYATCRSCTTAWEQLKIVPRQDVPPNQFCLPLLVGNAQIITVALIPAMFSTGLQANRQFDCVLGSRRVWPEHLALKASILYLFQGSPGAIWDLSRQVIQSALPRMWERLLRDEAPDEDFLRALLHPDVVEAGRLERPSHGVTTPPPTQRSISSHFLMLSRLYALSRFVSTLDEPDILVRDRTVCRAVASTMKIHPEQVDAVVQEANHNSCQSSSSSASLSPSVCEKISRVQVALEEPKIASAEGVRGTMMTPEAMEVLGMLGLFLSRDRKSLAEASRFETCSDADAADGLEVQQLQQTYTTTKALADCAMYCGAIRWLAEDDEDEEGIWTCLPCLHRWQRRGRAREAFQTRKLMHPMTLTPFTREEYYDPQEWDRIMEATRRDISRLGVDFYWGRCSTEGCGRICPAVARSGACAETDGVPLDDFPERVVLDDNDHDTIQLRRSLEALGPLGINNTVTSGCLESYFDSEEKLMYLPAPVRRRVRNCIDKSTYILPRGVLCDKCSALPEDAIDEYCPYCGTGFEPVFACVHYGCPQCGKHFCKACLGIDGIHFHGVYNARNHVCWRLLGNRYSYHNKGLCAKCRKERPWPASHALVSAGPEIQRKALLDTSGKEGMRLETAIQMQAANLQTFTQRYKEGVKIFKNCTHTVGLGPEYCHCGEGVVGDNYDDMYEE